MPHKIILISGPKLGSRKVAEMPDSAPLSAVARRMASVAFRKFGADRVARDDGSLCGYYANAKTGDALVCRSEFGVKA